jgi:hypothetical protein
VLLDLVHGSGGAKPQIGFEISYLITPIFQALWSAFDGGPARPDCAHEWAAIVTKQRRHASKLGPQRY